MVKDTVRGDVTVLIFPSICFVFAKHVLQSRAGV